MQGPVVDDGGLVRAERQERDPERGDDGEFKELDVESIGRDSKLKVVFEPSGLWFQSEIYSTLKLVQAQILESGDPANNCLF